ncbi:MAG: ice-binding family protein [Acidimicrobiales bacterium]
MTTVIRLARNSFLRRWYVAVLAVGTTAAMVGLGLAAGTASAAQPSVGLGTAASFGVLAGSTVTNTGFSNVYGDLGLYPGTSVTGFPPGIVHGTEHITDAAAQKAQADLTTAYNDAVGRNPYTLVTGDLGGQTLVPGVYKGAPSLGLTGTVTLDGQNDPNSVFIFQAPSSTLTTASNSAVALIRGAQACNVFWQVGSSATLGTNTNFVGTILALTSATLDTGATVAGRVLAQNGAVTLDDNAITVPTCNVATTTTTTAPTTTTTAPVGTGSSGSGGVGSGGVGIGAVIPIGAPQTGAGGASHSRDNLLVAFGGLGLAGAGLATGQVIRRRRALLVRDGRRGNE